MHVPFQATECAKILSFELFFGTGEVGKQANWSQVRSQYHSIGNVGWCVAAAAREFLWWAVFQLFANKSAVSHTRPHYTSSDVPRGFHEKLQADYLFSFPVAFHFATGGSCCANVIGCIANRTKTSNLS